MPKYFILNIVILISCISCKRQAASTENELPSDFMAFYEKFHSDSVFQMQHVQFPLGGLPSNSIESELQDTVFKWHPSNWVLHKPFDDQDKTFIREFTVVSPTIVIEMIYLNTKDYGMERRYSKDQDGWKLIYFVNLNRMKSNSKSIDEASANDSMLSDEQDAIESEEQQ